MIHKVRKKHQNSKLCFVCGLNNNFGIKAGFYELENNELVATFIPCELHQSYPGRLHGGISTAILDETIGRAIMIEHEEIWGVTVELNCKFRRPVPYDVELKVISRITNQNRRFFEGTGELILPNGEIAVTAWGKYIKLPIDKIADFDHEEQEWKVVEMETDPEEIEI
ncbi:MAG: PaaI family thioesterase [Candidatus Cloacimonetes bacterium]|nr:PaaI family thioesterase [Candidatus Cloacimonadota bacterium]MCF7814231.1 PaaI family thioesterase [Candidatus Cloacimonadota bacterium]MCF7868438.1 PaaI family thioesterase [Candidatus Cloacimonadota bacterium]MCF7883942.1 PaaI family thioesterase [Candidatus Cloacimonadota bacterium]